jgi:hypothetical protein
VGKPTLAELQTKLDGVRREVRNLTVMGMDPKAATRSGSTHQGTGAVSPRRNETALAHAKGKLRSHRQER